MCRGVADCQRALEDGGATTDGGRYSIHDLSPTTCTIRITRRGPFLILVSTQPPVHDIQIDHVTAFVKSVLLSVLNDGPKLPNFALTTACFPWEIGGSRWPRLAESASCASKTRR